MGEFSGRVSIVTGATRGIGKAIAAQLRSDGATVIGFGRDVEAGEAMERDLSGAQFIPVDVSDRASVNCIQASLRHLLKSPAGAIVAISSVVGETGNAGQANYAASKAGLVGLCRSVAKEVAGRGVRVNVVSPGFIETEMTARLSGELRRAYVDRIPLKRPGNTEEVANVVRFLLSSRASYITGQVIGVNGGLFP
jgi:3-oxoacyl-[acyl-carrier protein] reductase